MHSNYILSPELKERIEAVPSSSEFWTEHAALVAEHDQDSVREGFKNSLVLAWEMQSYSAALVHYISGLLERGSYPSWLLWWMTDNFWDVQAEQVSWYTKKIKTSLNDIALGTWYFFTDDLLCHPEERTWINFKDYGFETELEFIMSMSAYGISQVRSWWWMYKWERFISASWYEIEISSNDHHDPYISFRDQRVWSIISPFWNLVNFRPETLDGWFEFSQQTEPEILWTLFSFVSTHRNMHEVFGRDGSDLRSLFWYKANEYRLNEDSLKSFTRNAEKPLQVIWSNSDFKPILEHRLDRCVFVENEVW
jgi:hypothetical protein